MSQSGVRVRRRSSTGPEHRSEPDERRTQVQVWLLDVNVLVALAWPNHVGHPAALRWFTSNRKSEWATTPVTESGFVRVSSNRRALPTSTTPAIAVEMLHRLTALSGHKFWADTVRWVLGEHCDPNRLTGHRQITDAHLVALAREYDGGLVTFDRGVVGLAERARVQLLAP